MFSFAWIMLERQAIRWVKARAALEADSEVLVSDFDLDAGGGA